MSESIKRMLINAAQAEELRVALVNGQHLYNLDIETPGKEQQKSNIYKAKVTRVERSLGAVFADFGAERHGFLSGREISKEYFNKHNQQLANNPKQNISEQDLLENASSQPNYTEPSGTIENSDNPSTHSGHEVFQKMSVQDLITEGQELIVQVEKEQRGNKGAALTTFISLAGCYLVLMPNNPRAGGISKRIEGEERTEIKAILSGLNIPESMGVIVRTAGIGRSLEELQWDLDVLLNQWQAIQAAAKSKPAPFLIYQESNLVIRCIRDHLRPDIAEILIDDPKVFDVVYEHMRLMRPDFLSKVKLYNDSIPLFSRFQIESQIESAYQREVKLKSGGSLVIDHTEALTSIDINSAKATKGADIEETALQTNLEAVEEISRQLRLRDLGGLIVIDFIDMGVARHQREVEQRLHQAMSVDRAKVQLGKISKFGLLEMSRQRLRPALSESVEITCPRCSGKGSIRSVATMAVNIIRMIEEKSTEANIGMIIVELPIELATFLMNEKRTTINGLERKQNIKLIIVPNKYMTVPNYEIRTLSKEELGKFNKNDHAASYELINNKELHEYDPTKSTSNNPLPAAIITASPTTPAPIPAAANLKTMHKDLASAQDAKREISIIAKLWQMLVGKEEATSEKNNTTKRKYPNNFKDKVHYSKHKNFNKFKKHGKRNFHNNHKNNNFANNDNNSNNPEGTNFNNRKPHTRKYHKKETANEAIDSSE